ncbi:MAG: response regulator [Alphaproteobacteria bacterium]|nr:response regulator [Alphaproteobacteria bacterium]
MDRTDATNALFAAQVRALYQHIPTVLLVNVVNSALVAIVLASYKRQTWWLAFLALTIVLSGAHALGWARYRRDGTAAKSAARWAAAATVGSGLSGLLWGVSSAVLLPDNLVEQTFVGFVIGGMCAASLVAFSNYLPAFVAYVFPATLPMAARFFLDGWTVHGDMMAVFAVTMTLAAANSTREFVTGLRLNFDLTEKTTELIAANRRLRLEIEQRRAAENQLQQIHKMEAIGQLTGGIAHDFNNLLTVVIGHLEMVQARSGTDQRIAASLQTALIAAERGAALTRHLLAFARRQHLDPKSVEITDVLGAVEALLKQTIGPEIELLIRSGPDLHPAWVDPNQLELAILNLALNARDAMPGGGMLRIDAENRYGTDGNLPPDLQPNDYVVVSVTDTGVGMNKETLRRAFEPFFTTKEAGRGSGLGLSIVHGFAAQSGGSIEIASASGEGTKVDLWLPRAAARGSKGTALSPGPCVLERSSARILVCDDDWGVLTFVATALRDDGYMVWEAVTPFDALRIVQREQLLDLLVVDYAMPGMNGVNVIDRARATRRGLKVLLMSGHSDVLRSGGIAGIPLLPKPFKVAELRERISEVLGLHHLRLVWASSTRSILLSPTDRESRRGIARPATHN